ncbi:MAG: acetyl esterase/lipase [Verrucomicrobiales bacterium]
MSSTPRGRWLVGISICVAIFSSSFASAAPDSPTPVVGELFSYGSAPSEFGRLWIPEGGSARPTVVLLHGGFWRRRGGDLSLMTPLAERFVEEGFAVWNVEYGRTGESRGGWPDTFEHVRESLTYVSRLQGQYGMRSSGVVVIGHSAGGHLALWASSRADDRRAPIVGVVALAPIVDLELAAVELLGNGAVVDLLGGSPAQVPAIYGQASVLPLSVPALILTGSADDHVPSRFSGGLLGLAVRTEELAGASHLDLIAPHGAAADEIVTFLERIAPDRE